MSSTDDQMVAEYLGRLETAAGILPPERRAELIDEITTHIAEARAAQQDAAAGTPASVPTVLDRLGSPEDIVRAAAEQGGTGSGPFETGRSASGSIGPGFGSPSYGQPGSHQPGPGGWPGPPGWQPPSGWHAPPGWQPSPGYGGSGSIVSRQGLGWMEVVAIVLLLIGGFLAGIGWIAGVIMLWLSPRWRLSDKLLATFVWPGGLAGVLLVLGAGALLPAHESVCAGASATGQLASCAASSGLPAWAGVLLALTVIGAGLGGPILVTVRLVRQARRWATDDGGPAAMQPL